MLRTVTSFRVFAGLTAAQLTLAETVFRHSSWHDSLVDTALGFTLGIAFFAKRMRGTRHEVDVESYRLTS